MDRTTQAVLSQTKALHSELFEVGVFDAVAQRMHLRTWDTAGILKSLPWLKHQNANGRNIYIRPHGEHSMSLVDDLTKQAVTRMKVDGYQPAAVIETSPGNYQAWLHHGQVLPKDVSTEAARDLAKRYGGDLKSTDWRHFGRLAGFTNRKPKYQDLNGRYPFCTLIEATGHVYDKAPVLVERVQRIAEDRRKQFEEQRQAVANIPHQPTKSIEDFRRDFRYNGDLHRVDLAYAVYAASHGMPESQIRAAIATRDLSKKGNPSRQQTYISNTYQKALKSLGLSR